MLDNNMTLMEPAGKGLIYNGTLIRDKGEMLSLTDMWKAAGEPENKRPAEWTRKEGSAFIDFVAEAHNVAHSHIMKSQRGKNGGTFGHWQIGIAYAKYLSHDFHMWGNQAIREKMEGLPPQVGLSPDVADAIERSLGIVKMLAHKVTTIEHSLPAMLEAMTHAAVAAKMADENLLYRRGQTAKQIWDNHGLPEKMRGTTLWLGNRLDEMGCGVMKAECGNKAIRIYDPDKAAACMKNGLHHKAKVYCSEKWGQGRLKLVEGRA